MKTKSELEDAYLESKVNTSNYDIASYRHQGEIDTVINRLSELDPVDKPMTFRELAEYLDEMDNTENRTSFLFDSECDLDLMVLDAFYPHWVDVDAVRERSDNILSPDYHLGEEWKTHFSVACAQYLVEKGKLVSHNDSNFGWVDHYLVFNGQDIIGVYNIKMDFWNEFEHTFTDDSSHSGYKADVLLSTGHSRVMRVEAEMGEIVRGLTS